MAAPDVRVPLGSLSWRAAPKATSTPRSVLMGVVHQVTEVLVPLPAPRAASATFPKVLEQRRKASLQHEDTSLRCPRGHTMKARVSRELWTRRYQVSCDECQKCISARDASYYCKTCTRSICMSCAAARQTAWCSVSWEPEPERPLCRANSCPAVSRDPYINIMAGDILLCGPDLWGIHHVVLCGSPMNVAEPCITERISIHHPGVATEDILWCKTIESTRPLAGREFPWYPAFSVFARQRSTGKLRLVGDVGEGTSTLAVTEVPVPVKLLLHPFRPDLAGLPFDSGRFEAATKLCAEESRQWSRRTAIKALTAKRRAINPADFADLESRRGLMAELRRRWRKKPICSSVAIQVWQKYFEMSFKETDLAVQHILRWMPVCCDQTSPSLLVKVLSSCGWILLENIKRRLVSTPA